MQTILMVFLLTFGLAACKSSKESANKPNIEQSFISFERMKAGEYCGVSEERQVLITSQEAWEKLWNEIHKNVLPKPELAPVDFSHQWVVACFLGTKNSGGHKIEIQHIELKAEQLLIQAKAYAPGKNCMATMALTQPYELVLIKPQKTKELVFESTLEREDC